MVLTDNVVEVVKSGGKVEVEVVLMDNEAEVERR